MNTYTAFCQEDDGTGTIWIAPVKAESMEAAKEQAVKDCARDWGRDGDDWKDGNGIHLLGLAAGDVKIIEWNDLNT